MGAPEWASCGDVAYCDHYVERSMAVSEEMVFETCWLHGPTLWGLNFDTYRWSCPLDGCDTYLNEESRVKRGLPTILVPPLFGFTRRLP